MLLNNTVAPSDTPGWITRGRIPGLDGLRAISIALVLVAHTLIAGGHEPRWVKPNAIGMTGVDVFFVISGFLITLLMLRERSRTGGISLGGFYRRRALRILPAYIAFLGAVFLATRVGWEQVARGDWAAALTYTMNFRSEPAWSVGHIWSLSVEEQFYLLWPPMMILLSPRAARRVLVGCIVFAPLFRAAMRVLIARDLLPDYRALYTMSFPARLEPIAAGCLLALLAADPRGRAWLDHWCRGWAGVAAAIIVAAAVLVASRSKGFSLIGRSTLNGLALPIIVWACANAGTSTLGRFLNWRPVVTLGVLSYSIYLWQQPFMNPNHASPAACRFPVNLVLALVAAALSYVLIERPFLRIKDKRPSPVQIGTDSAAVTTR